MSGYKVYISYVIQQAEHHVHASALVEFPLPVYSFYLDNSGHQVVKWAGELQAKLPDTEKVIVLNFFNVPNVK